MIKTYRQNGRQIESAIEGADVYVRFPCIADFQWAYAKLNLSFSVCPGNSTTDSKEFGLKDSIII